MKLVTGLMTALFFLGWIGSIATVVLFCAELIRTMRSKDDTPEHHATVEENFQ